mgnify:CR=1 FL=1
MNIEVVLLIHICARKAAAGRCLSLRKGGEADSMKVSVWNEMEPLKLSKIDCAVYRLSLFLAHFEAFGGRTLIC